MATLVAANVRMRLVKFKFGGFEFDTSKFDELSAVKFFNAVSRAAISPVDDADIREGWNRAGGSYEQASPVLMMHAGWTLVCEAFVVKFKVYPDDAEVRKVASVIGGQNVDFVLNYRRAYDAAIREGTGVPLEFAREYLRRAPSLAQRIHPVIYPEDEALAVRLLRVLPR
ncbi:MAG: hypothetical protein JWR84_2751 [Caulobacter sp.]|nr:hypothetical protein [Caulobacter sp.]